MPRHEIMESMFANPIMLDDLDFLYKSDNARKVLFFHQVRSTTVSVSTLTLTIHFSQRKWQRWWR